MTRRFNLHHIPLNRAYSVTEVARILGLGRGDAVYGWIKRGLPIVPGSCPKLIRAEALVAWLRSEQIARKTPCRPNEMYCFRCKIPRECVGHRAEYRALTPQLGKLCAVCVQCGGRMARTASLVRVEAGYDGLTIDRELPPDTLVGSPGPNWSPAKSTGVGNDSR
jgi:hypothetical protein